MSENITDKLNILNDDEDFWASMGVVKNTEEEVDSQEKNLISDKKTQNIESSVSEFKRDDIPVIMPCVNSSSEYMSVVNRIIGMYKQLPIIKYDEIYKEIKSDSISIKQNVKTPSPSSIGIEFQRVQAAKERLGEIVNEVTECYNKKKRAVDVLRDIWPRFISEKMTADSRKSDAIYVTCDFERDLAEIEALFKVCIHIEKMLDSYHDTLSRRVTCMQTELKYSELARGGSLPDYDFKSKFNNDENKNEEKDTEVIEKDFPGQ